MANSHKVKQPDPEIIVNFYLNCVAELGGCPVKLRTGCETENSAMAAMQCTPRRCRSSQVWVVSVKPKDCGHFTEETGLVAG